MPALLKVDPELFPLTKDKASLPSRVLMSLCNLPRLVLRYHWYGGSPTNDLAVLRHFARLRYLTVLLDSEHTDELRSLASHLTNALLALPSLVAFAFIVTNYSGGSVGAVSELRSVLQQLTREQLSHIVASDEVYDLLTGEERYLDRDTPAPATQLGYPRVESLYLYSTQHPAIDDWCHLFPNVKHFSQGWRSRLDMGKLAADGKLSLLNLASLTVQVDTLVVPTPVARSARPCELRCLIIILSSTVSTDMRERVRDMLVLTPLLTQLCITGQPEEYVELTETMPSVFSPLSPLPRLTFLQFVGGLLLSDLEYLLSPTSPPAFAATLTHLHLRVRVHDRQPGHLMMPILPNLYPSLLQLCINWEPASASGFKSSVERTILAARLDVAWREEAGLLYAWFEQD